jgi:hypothetical protein
VSLPRRGAPYPPGHSLLSLRDAPCPPFFSVLSEQKHNEYV